jgi:N-acyl-D-amino-acid deacylase
LVIAGTALAGGQSPVAAEEPVAADARPVPAAIRGSVKAGLPLLIRSARAYTEKKSCFSCHHQTLPVLAAVASRSRGFPVADDWLNEQFDFSKETFASRVEPMRKGEGIGGASMTVAYGLWTLDLAGRKADDVTAAMVDFLIARQEENGIWKRSTHRPPLEESNPFATFLASYYMDKFATETQRDAVDGAVARAADWLKNVRPASQEDANAVLWWSVSEAADDAAISRSREAVLRRQNEDGGWGQLETMASDAYATGQTLFVLQEAGMTLSDTPVARAVTFLLESQHGDGSWLVETRSRPVQRFFDNGDPHGQHQFISTAATGWAVAALARTLPEEQEDAP